MKKGIAYLIGILILTGCAKKRNNPVPILPPSTVVLLSPLKNSVCTSGTTISATESAITFNWNAAANADNYNLVVKNLISADSATFPTALTQATITLLRNSPYSWYVVSGSKQSKLTAKSDVWKFYASGPGIINFIPFPAEIILPVPGEHITAGIINLTWKGGVAGGNAIANYDVYFGTSNQPGLYKSTITDEFINDVTVTSGNTYYWKVITRDNNGDTSDSGIYQFSVN